MATLKSFDLFLGGWARRPAASSYALALLALRYCEQYRGEARARALTCARHSPAWPISRT
jgi:hypothetical protein